VRPLFGALGLLCALTLVMCGPESLGDGEKRRVVHELVDAVIVPTLDELSQRSDQLAQACRTLSEEPTQQNLNATQQAWRDARAPWKRTEAFAFGPVMDLRIDVAIDQSPISGEGIDEVLQSQEAIDAAAIDELGANRKGFHALEYLLFSEPADTAVLTLLTSDELAPRRRLLLVALADNLLARVQELHAAWTEGRHSHGRVLTDPGDDNDEYPTIKSVLDTLVNESVALSERVADSRLAAPLGLKSGGAARPDLAESPLSDNSLADARANLIGMRDVYLGTQDGKPGEGITRLVQTNSPATDRAVRDAFTAALQALDAVPQPFSEALHSDRDRVQRAFAAVSELEHLLASEVVGSLGATLRFSSNDGD
jgi:predicted lipoprotein